MDMVEIFLELIVSVGLSVAVYYMVMKLQSRGEEVRVETCIKSNHVSGQEGEKQSLIYDIGKNERVWSFSDFLDLENMYGTEVIYSSELTSEVVEDVVVLQSEKINSFCDENSNVIDDNEVMSALVEVESSKTVQEKVERSNICKIESKLSENIEVKCSDEEGLFDDWEGIERTELEKVFGAAVAFVGSKSNGGLINKELKIELYGFHKIAIQGPCEGSQPPTALKVSARAKWKSWKRVGNMNRELAMEQYLSLLSKSIPDWINNSTLVKQRRSSLC